MQVRPPLHLLGYPIKWTEKCATLGTTGDIMLVDLSQYAVGHKAGSAIEVAKSIHLWFDYDITAFRFVMRVDGQPLWNDESTGVDGTDTSPYVVLATKLS